MERISLFKLIIGLILIAVVAYLFGMLFDSIKYELVDTIEIDRTIVGGYNLEADERILIKGKTQLTIEGLSTIEGLIECEDGPLTLIFDGDAIINGILRCNRDENLSEDDVGNGILLVLKGNATFGPEAQIISNGNIQIVDQAENLALNPREINEAYEEAGRGLPEGNQIGPFLPFGGESEPIGEVRGLNTVTEPIMKKIDDSKFFIKEAKAEEGPKIIISGELKVKQSRVEQKQIILLRFSGFTSLTFQDFSLESPDGFNGEDDLKRDTCTATRTTEGKGALRFNAYAANITINNFKLVLGDGGNGGSAESDRDCDNALAQGQDGGQSGNFIITAGGEFDIKGAFMVYPGRSGDGGYAIAHGRHGDSGKVGGSTEALAGNGADNKKTLAITGAVNGRSKIQVGGIKAGHGGLAYANSGDGGSGAGCTKDGGDGGDATAFGGNGGIAVLEFGGNANRISGSLDVGGDGGDATASAGLGGKGGDCDPSDGGGNGAEGGDAGGEIGKGGIGRDTPGKDGEEDFPGGNAGRGGDGCGGGSGGIGGSGEPVGKDGKDGENICEKEGGATAREENITDNNQAAESAADPDVTLAIDYYSDLIPVSQLYKEVKHSDGDGACASEHWHSEGDGAYTVDLKFVADPEPNGCGFGLTSEFPITEYSSN